DFMPVGVFNLSITPNQVIEETHNRMKKTFNPSHGPWTRSHMPRTVLVFIDEVHQNARDAAEKALATYWKAIEGTLDPKRVEQAVGNALIGTPAEIISQMEERFHPEDRLMLWFDLNNHDNEAVMKSMRTYMEKVAPHV
ncbi:MAG: luciferase, partial [Bdellovibrionota bacterium]